MKIGYICESCDAVHTTKSFVFNCIWCGKECCEDCMYGFATCTKCAAGKTELELGAKFEETPV